MADEEVVGTAVIRVVVDRDGADRDLEQGVRDSQRRVREQGVRDGAEYGDAYSRALRRRLEAASKALPKARLDFDETTATGKLARLQLELSSLADERYRASIGIDDKGVLERVAAIQLGLRELTSKDQDVSVRVNAGAALKEVTALRGELGDTGNEAKKATKDAEHGFNLMRTAIEQIGPTLVPIAGGALALGSAVVGLGAAGVLAVKGATAAYKAGTPVGQAYAGVIREGKTELEALEKTASSGVLDGFSSGVRKVTAQFPALNSEIAASSKNLGDITSHLIGGAAGGFVTFGPLIQKAEGYVDQLAGRFEAWATGPGGEHFAATLSEDFDHFIPALENVVTLASHLITAFNPIGTTLLDNLSTFSNVIDHIPVGVLQAGATAYIAWRTAVTVTAGIEAASKALKTFAIAETEAAAASGAAGAGAAASATRLQRTAGGVAALTTRLIPYAAAWVGATIAVDTAANATDKWAGSTDALKSSLHGGLVIAQDFLSLNWSKIGGDIAAGASAGRAAATKEQAQAEINNTGLNGRSSSQIVEAEGARVAYQGQRQEMTKLRAEMDAGVATVRKLNAEQADITAVYGAGSVQVRKQQAAIDAELKVVNAAADRYNKLKVQTAAYTAEQKTQIVVERQLEAARQKTADAYSRPIDRSNDARLANTYQQNPLPTNAITGLQSYTKGMQSAIDAQQKWTKVTDDDTVSFQAHGRTVTYETKAFNAAMALSNNNAVKAQGILLGHSQALAIDEAALKRAQYQQGNLTDAVAAAEDKYKINDDQLNVYAATIGVTAQQLAEGTVGQQRFVDAVGQVKGVIDQGNTAMQGWVSAVATFTAGADTAASRAQLMGAAMVALNGDTLGYANQMAGASTANQQFVTDFDNAKKSVINLKTGVIDYHNAAAAPLLRDLQGLQTAAMNAASATYQHEVSIKGSKTAAKDAADVYRQDTSQALISEARQLGLTHDQAKKLADTYFHWPKDAKTQIEQLGGGKVQATLAGILQDLDRMSGGHHADLYLTGDTEVISRLNAVRGAIESVQGGHVTSVHFIGGSTASARGNLFNAYARGGTEDHSPQIAQPSPSGRVRVWAEHETGGEAYIPLANDTRRPRAREIAAETVKRLGGVAKFAIGGFTGVQGASGPNSGGSNSTFGGSSSKSKSSGSGSTGGISAATLKSIQTAMTAYTRSVTKDLATVKAAESSLVQALVKLPGSQSGLLKWLAKEDAGLNKVVAHRDVVAAQLKKAREHLLAVQTASNTFASNTAGTIHGAFDVATAGTGYNGTSAITFDSILAQALQTRNKATRLRTLVAKLIHEGIDPDYIRSITSRGVDSLPQVEALATATPAQLKRLGTVDNQLTAAGKGLGADASKALYGKSIATSKALINGFNPHNAALKGDVKKLADAMYGVGKYSVAGLTRGLLSQDKSLDAAVARIAARIEYQLKHKLKIASPSKLTDPIGGFTTKGIEVGMLRGIPGVERASAKVAGATVKHLDPRIRDRARAGSVPVGGGQSDPRIDALLDAMHAFFQRGFTLEADGQKLARFIQKENNVLARIR